MILAELENPLDKQSLPFTAGAPLEPRAAGSAQQRSSPWNSVRAAAAKRQDWPSGRRRAGSSWGGTSGARSDVRGHNLDGADAADAARGWRDGRHRPWPCCARPRRTVAPAPSCTVAKNAHDVITPQRTCQTFRADSIHLENVPHRSCVVQGSH